MKVSQTGLDLIKHFEGLSLKAYKCPAGAGGSGALNRHTPGGPHAAVAGGNGAAGLVIVRVYS